MSCLPLGGSSSGAGPWSLWALPATLHAALPSLDPAPGPQHRGCPVEAGPPGRPRGPAVRQPANRRPPFRLLLLGPPRADGHQPDGTGGAGAEGTHQCRGHRPEAGRGAAVRHRGADWVAGRALISRSRGTGWATREAVASSRRRGLGKKVREGAKVRISSLQKGQEPRLQAVGGKGAEGGCGVETLWTQLWAGALYQGVLWWQALHSPATEPSTCRRLTRHCLFLL